MVSFGLSEDGATLRANPVLRCLDDPEGLANSLRYGTAVPSQDLSGA
jgi:hypothetical protein